ncbi:uncharacterized protein ACIGJ3_008362 [Trichechus inunguis]
MDNDRSHAEWFGLLQILLLWSCLHMSQSAPLYFARFGIRHYHQTLWKVKKKNIKTDPVSCTVPTALKVDLQLQTSSLLDFTAGLQPRTGSSCTGPLIYLTVSSSLLSS